MSIYKESFNGADYQPARDDERLSRQIDRVFGCMKDGRPRTLGQIAAITGDPEASVSAQLRHLKKKKFAAEFGNWDLGKRHIDNGLYIYWLSEITTGQQDLL